MTNEKSFDQEAYENICEALISQLKMFSPSNSDCSDELFQALDYLDFTSGLFNGFCGEQFSKLKNNLINDLFSVLDCIDKIIKAFDTSAANLEAAMKSDSLFNSFISTNIASAGTFATLGAVSANKDIKTLAAEMNAAKKKYDDIYVTGPDAAQRKQKAYEEYKAAKKAWETEYYKQRGLNPDGTPKQTKTVDTQKTAAASGTKTQAATKTITTQQTTAKTASSSQSTGGTTAKSGTSSELEKKLKVQEEEAEKAFIEKRKAEAAAEEAQDKANRAAAEKQEEEKRRHMAEAEAENAKEEATKLKTENEELKKKLEKTDTPSEVTPQTEPKPEVTPEPTPAEQPKPASEPAPAQEPAQTQSTSQPQKQVYTQPSVQQQTSSTEPVVEIKPNEQIKIEPVTPTEQPTETPTEKPSTTPLPNPNADDTGTGTGSTSKSSGSSVVPIAVGLGAAVAGGIGIKAIHDHKKNSKFDDQNEDSVTNGNRFWTDEDPNVMHTEEDLFNENIDTNDVSYQAVENNSVTPDLDTNINNDTWSIEEDEIKDNNTFDLLSENN